MNENINFASQGIETLVESVSRALPTLAAGLLIILVFLVASRVVRQVCRRLAARASAERRPLVDLASQVLRYGLIVLGLITGLGTMGVDVSALVAGLGLTGFALGFAFRDALSNVLAGVMIILCQPFLPGDTINVAGKTGRVRAINFRYTVLEDDGKTIHVPNGATFGTSVTVLPPPGHDPAT